MKLRAVKTRDKRPDWGSWEYAAMRERLTGTHLWRSVGPRRRPKRQHAIETETIDRLRNAALLDLPRDCAQAKRIERNRRRRTQKGQVAEPIDQLKIDRLAAGEDPSVRDFVEQRVVHAAPRLHQIAKPRIGVLDQRVEGRTRFRTGRFKAIGCGF